MDFFLNVCTEFNEFGVITVKGLEPATQSPLVRDQGATTVPARHMLETGSLNQGQFMLQWLSISLNSVKVLLHLGKTPLYPYVQKVHVRSESSFLGGGTVKPVLDFW